MTISLSAYSTAGTCPPSSGLPIDKETVYAKRAGGKKKDLLLYPEPEDASCNTFRVPHPTEMTDQETQSKKGVQVRQKVERKVIKK